MRIKKCRVMNSKMRLLWILFQNWDQHGDELDDGSIAEELLPIPKVVPIQLCTVPVQNTMVGRGTIKVVLNAETPNRRMTCSRRDDRVQEGFTNRQMKA
ncbi:hypothetical protein CBL_21117 [Carabus blaptoides fortunei]